MKLNKQQMAFLKKHHWDLAKPNKGDEVGQILNIYPEDGVIFQEVVDTFGWCGDGKDGVQLLVIATAED